MGNFSAALKGFDGAGLKVSPLSFQFERVTGLKAWHLHQLNTGELRLYFDGETPTGDIQQQLAKQLQNIVSGRDYELVEGVWELERGGKFKRVTSDLTCRGKTDVMLVLENPIQRERWNQ